VGPPFTGARRSAAPRVNLPRSYAPVGRRYDPAAPKRRPTPARGHSSRSVSLRYLLDRRLRHFARSSRAPPLCRSPVGAAAALDRLVGSFAK
jgi:hypothetical protein